uniref:Uncharacterized protein n=1 Tax=Anguilla anguilla TaxID=7936 RepID=A0A0E9WNY7_ANGAN
MFRNVLLHISLVMVMLPQVKLSLKLLQVGRLIWSQERKASYS